MLKCCKSAYSTLFQHPVNHFFESFEIVADRLSFRPKAALQSATNQPNQANAFFFDLLPQPPNLSSDDQSENCPATPKTLCAEALFKRRSALREGAF